jgi:hypothetical protein
MFVVEVGAGLMSGSASLQADALDFLGDAANYGISLFVAGMALHYRASAALAKGATMAAFGLWVVGTGIWHAVNGTLPSAFTMGTVGIAQLSPPMLHRSDCYGRTATATPTCVLLGFALAMMCSATSLYCLRPSVFLAPVLDGQTSSSL